MSGVKLTSMANATTTVTVTWFGEEVDVVVRPGALNRGLFTAMQDDPSFDTLAAQIKSLVVSWDVLDDNGEPLPVSDEVIGVLPLAFMRAVTEAAVESVGQQGNS